MLFSSISEQILDFFYAIFMGYLSKYIYLDNTDLIRFKPMKFAVTQYFMDFMDIKIGIHILKIPFLLW